jgi:hypothetical protein
MTEAITIPAPAELLRRIDECRRELAALKRLHRLALSAQESDRARARERLTVQTSQGVTRAS